MINQILEREEVTVNQLRSKPHGDFPGRPVVKTPCFYRRGMGQTPGRVTKGVNQADRRGGPGGAGLSTPLLLRLLFSTSATTQHLWVVTVSQPLLRLNLS